MDKEVRTKSNQFLADGRMDTRTDIPELYIRYSRIFLLNVSQVPIMQVGDIVSGRTDACQTPRTQPNRKSSRAQ